jgi:hypothetical protein
MSVPLRSRELEFGVQGSAVRVQRFVKNALEQNPEPRTLNPEPFLTAAPPHFAGILPVRAAGRWRP